MMLSRPVSNEHQTLSPAVSWLLCTHVANEQLKSAIQSCVEQDFQDFELLVVTNGSKALEVAAEVRSWYGDDARVRIFTTPVRQLSFSLSLGLHHARGALVARMDSDDLSSPERLQRQVEFMRQHADVAVLGTAYDIIDEHGQVQHRITMPLTDRQIRRALLRGNPLCHPTVMFRRDVVLEAGGYMGGLHAEDYDLWARLALNRRIQFANLAHCCLGYRVIGVGNARRSRWAYASMASSQFRNFLMGGGISWAGAVLLSGIKLLLRSSPVRHGV